MTEKSLTLKNNPDYFDLADRWSAYEAPKLAVVELDGPGQVKIGQEATFDVYVTYNDAAYPANEIKQGNSYCTMPKTKLFQLVKQPSLRTVNIKWFFDAATTAKLEAGSNKLEIAVVPITVSNQPHVC